MSIPYFTSTPTSRNPDPSAALEAGSIGPSSAERYGLTRRSSPRLEALHVGQGTGQLTVHQPVRLGDPRPEHLLVLVRMFRMKLMPQICALPRGIEG